MVRVVVDSVLAAGPDQVIMVVGSEVDRLRAAVTGCAVTVVENPHWNEGLSSSLRAGLEQLRPDMSACLFVLGDQPGITSEIIRTLINAYRTRWATIVVPTFRGRRGTPVLFDRGTFEDLRQVIGDQGGRNLVAAGRFPVYEVEVSSEAILLDIDRPDDVQALGA
jgi:molybdenum cofactor cytidylyltransferase